MWKSLIEMRFAISSKGIPSLSSISHFVAEAAICMRFPWNQRSCSSSGNCHCLNTPGKTCSTSRNTEPSNLSRSFLRPVSSKICLVRRVGKSPRLQWRLSFISQFSASLADVFKSVFSNQISISSNCQALNLPGIAISIRVKRLLLAHS